MNMLSNSQTDLIIRMHAAKALGTIIKIRSKQQIDTDMHAGESRSPERRQGDRSGEGSSTQGEPLLDQVRSVLEERNQARQDHDRFQRQLTLTQQERNQAQQNLHHTWEQLTLTQQERDQAQQELEQLRLAQQMGELGLSSRGDLGANDALPAREEDMQKRLEGEYRRLQVMYERVLQLQAGFQRTLRERGEDMPRNGRLNELLRQGIWNLVGYHRLDEMLFPRQEHRQLPSLRQRVRNFYLQTVSESTSPLGLTQEQIAQEFVDQLKDQLETHHRPNQEYIDTVEDVQEEVAGSRPNRTRH